MKMHRPPHPGQVVLDCLKHEDLSITDGANRLGVSRKALSSLVNEHAGVSTEMAIKLSETFGSTPRLWLMLQLKYDLWSHEHKVKKNTISKRKYDRTPKKNVA